MLLRRVVWSMLTNVSEAYCLQHQDNEYSSSSGEVLEDFLARGIINWGTPVSRILDKGMLFIQQARTTETSGLVSVLLEGPPNSGKTALAAQIAKNSDFPFVKVCTPE
ncbi:Vesicle-fusing ATPase 1 [Zootermopsis nevadensis]|uniref:Vesicle-fusing ATPase n=1 Tax=Zootermopsis nevadensis TaxID=136037 RepID=A0A067R359_ZOONE|nr:Vesicle-fusing ATPase 1 [Zootermopsis nevadensis]